MVRSMIVGWGAALLLSSALLGTGAMGAAAQEPLVEDDLGAVAFMAGCWRGETGPGRYIFERWGPVVEPIMLGATLFVRDGRAVQHELGEILRLPDGRIRYTPYPGGDESPHAFFLTARDDGSATFEAPEHDYPKRIHYRLLADGRLQAGIDGGPADPEPRVWVMAPMSCGRIPWRPGARV